MTEFSFLGELSLSLMATNTTFDLNNVLNVEININ